MCCHSGLTKFVHPNSRKMMTITLKLWRDCSIEHLKQQLKKKKKKELPFWSPQGIIRIFWMGMMVELSKMRQYPRNSEKKQEFPIIYMEGTMKWEKRGRNWSFKLLWVDWMVTNIMIRCWAVGWINTVWILFSSLPKIVTLGKFPCF